jgi:hypothetical protein
MSGTGRGKRVRFSNRPSYRADPQVLNQIESCSPKKRRNSSASQQKLIDSIESSSPVRKTNLKRTPINSRDVSHCDLKSLYSIEIASPLSKRRKSLTADKKATNTPISDGKRYCGSCKKKEKPLLDLTPDYQSFVDQIECSSPIRRRSTPRYDYEAVKDIEIPSQGKKPGCDSFPTGISFIKEDSRWFQKRIKLSKRKKGRNLFSSTKGTFGKCDESVTLSASGEVVQDFMSAFAIGMPPFKFDDDSTVLQVHPAIVCSKGIEGSGIVSKVKKQTVSKFQVMALTARLVKLVNTKVIDREIMISDLEAVYNTEKDVLKSINVIVVRIDVRQRMAVLQCFVTEIIGFPDEEAFEFEEEKVQMILPDEWVTGMSITPGNVLQVVHPFHSRRGDNNQLVITNPFWLKVMSRGEPPSFEKMTRFKFDCPCRVTFFRPSPEITFETCRPVKEGVIQIESSKEMQFALPDTSFY